MSRHNSCKFILFDVFAEHDPLGVWLPRSTVEDIAAGMDIPVVPVLWIGSLTGAIERVETGFMSFVAEDKTLLAEGLVMRPEHELRDRMGRRIIAKVKYKDFPR